MLGLTIATAQICKRMKFRLEIELEQSLRQNLPVVGGWACPWSVLNRGEIIGI